MRTPNLEQKLAIENLMGLTLSAGAGAGKTYVLVEHFVFRMKHILSSDFRGEFSETKLPLLQTRLLSLVLITFTKKASAELLERLKKRLDECLTETDEQDLKFWKAVSDNIHLVTLSTIHGFCQKVIGQRIVYVPIAEVEILDDVAYKDKLNAIFSKYIEEKVATIPKKLQLFLPDIFKAMLEIFSSVELRIYWDENELSKNLKSSFDDLVRDYIKLNGLEEIFTNEKLSLTSPKKATKASELLEIYNQFKGECTGLNFDSLIRYGEMLASASNIRTTKDLDLAETNALKLISRFNKLLKDDGFLDSFQKFNENEKFFKELHELMTSIFKFMNLNYYQTPGISYNDLEYLILKYMSSQESREVFGKQFDYIIVDEYQDTSVVQFEILKNFTNQNFSKVFAVGDLKQAIYGFRGGEVNVFNETMRQTDLNLSLSYNYRSKASVINFNNRFFNDLFPLGVGFEGSDHFSLPYECQKIPELKDGAASSINLIPATISVAKKPSSQVINVTEAKLICEQLEKIFGQNPNAEVAILYRKLSPSVALVEELRAKKIGFRAQSKILFGNEPVYLISEQALEFLIIKESKDAKLGTNKIGPLLEKLKKLFILIEVSVDEDEINMTLSILHQNYKNFGIAYAIETFMFGLGLSNSRAEETWDKIRTIFKIKKFDLPLMYQALKDLGATTVTTRISENGSNKSVEIMTVHASKGLEFDHVFVAGIHNNDSASRNRKRIGERFLSYNWKLKSTDKKSVKTPWYIFESLTQKLKEFSESKRLFYVANTRARSHLYFTNISYAIEGKDEMKDYALNDNAWINGVRYFLENGNPALFNILEMKNAMPSSNEEDAEVEEYDNDQVAGAPTLLSSNLGLKVLKRNVKLGIIGELSVTKLSELNECPRKFYLSSVLKVEAPKEHLTFSEDDTNEEDIIYIPSTKERGIEKHKEIQNYFQNLNKKESLSVEASWGVAQIEAIKLTKSFSEYELKFPYFGQMISGTPDWFGFNEADKFCHVVDFKTGTVDSEKELKYYAQLQIYAYAIIKFFDLDNSWKFKLSIYSLDQKRTFDWEQSSAATLEFNKNLWNKITELNRPRISHCSHCAFNSYCREK